ncbi:MAG TPA: PepSY domain-containing protein [Rubricoccaceae bacterium]|jgi:uncharacterized membrane protein YkoI|nr:PepSY domain-containing protein [Rubricoccaceae bacterium]
MTIQPLIRIIPLLVLVVGLSATAAAQATEDCGPIQGTITVADDASDFAAMAQVTEAQAQEAALGAVAGATVVDVDLEEEYGFLVYEVDLTLDGQEREVYVDAGSGAVLCVETED